jgi:hypothetical protein
MKLGLLVLTLSLLTVQSQAAQRAPTVACLKKAVAAVNKHHTLAEGNVYALRELYNGEFASVLLVGHSDETDPTDYLVTVETRRGCVVKSIVYTNEASGVEDWKESEYLENIFK